MKFLRSCKNISNFKNLKFSRCYDVKFYVFVADYRTYLTIRGSLLYYLEVKYQVYYCLRFWVYVFYILWYK
jgi:hypothetical protein